MNHLIRLEKKILLGEQDTLIMEDVKFKAS